MGKAYFKESAEREANEIAYRFMDSSDVVKDMSRAYHADFSKLRFHTGGEAENKVRSAGKDALASGKDLFFGKGILGSSDPAAKGLVAHELAHTMQQGITVGDGGGVAESAPAGAEQGGLISWFKGLFKKKPKVEHLGGKASKDPESLRYMEMMRQAEADKMLRGRENAMNSVNIEAAQGDQDKYDQMAELNGLTQQQSNEKWNAGGDGGRSLNISNAFMGFGHRELGQKQGRLEKDLREQVFANTSKNYSEYIESLTNSGVNFSEMANNLKEDWSGSKQVRVSKDTLGISSDMMSIMEQYLSTDEGMRYMDSMMGQVEGADVFKDTGISPMSYILQTMMTGEAIRVKNATVKPVDDQRDVNQNGRNKVMTAVTQNLMQPMKMDLDTQENRDKRPEELKQLYAQYQKMRERLEAALVQYQQAKKTG